MNYLVIYPGRFQPFHRGHQASYDYLVQKYGAESVYIATSDVPKNVDPETSPFDYADKVKMMTKLGVPASRIVRVKNPYQAKEIVDSLSDEEKGTTALIFAVSEKDGQRFTFTNKNGEPAYLQPMPKNIKKLQPMTKHGYVAITPTVNFRVKGQDANSATAIRKLYREGSDHDRAQIIADLYGAPDAELQATFDKKLGVTDPSDAVIYGQEKIFAGDNPVRVMKERREQLQAKITHLREQLAQVRATGISLQNPAVVDYIDEKTSRKK